MAGALVVVVGIDGPDVSDVLRGDAETCVLALEPRPDVATAVTNRPEWNEWSRSGRLTLLTGPDYAGSTDASRRLGRVTNVLPHRVSPTLVARAPEAAVRAGLLAQRIVVGARNNEIARQKFAGPYLCNTLTNLPAIASEGDVASLYGRFSGVPALVVGAGPSLDRNVAALVHLQERALVIAVDTAVRPLLAAGIRPHLIVSVDPSEVNARHLDRLPDTRGMWLVAEGSLDSRVFEQFRGRTFFFRVANHHPWPWLAEQGAGCGLLDAWGSVLTSAFDLAVRAGCGPIVFAGADLAYTGDQIYCRNTVYESEWAHLADEERAAHHRAHYFPTRPMLMERGVDGVPVRSAQQFVQFRDWIAQRAAGATGVRVINATGAGILHGPAIEQAALDALALPRTTLASGPYHDSVADAWGASVRARSVCASSIRVALSDRRMPVHAWVEFAAPSKTAADIDSRIAAAVTDLEHQAAQAAYLARQRAMIDEQIGNRADAWRLSYGDVDAGRRQAAAQHAHLLLDALQRSYPVESGASVADIVRASSTWPGRLRALDFGCGMGRGMSALAAAGVRVDGVDISRRMLEWARQEPGLQRSQFFLTEGDTAGGAPEGAYDLAYSFLCFRYVRPRSVRLDILRALARALRPGATAVVQMRFFPYLQSGTVPAPHVPWSSAALDVDTPGEMWPTPDELGLIYADFSRQFVDVRMQIIDLPPTAGEPLPSQLIVSGTTGRRLAARVNAPLFAEEVRG